MKKTICTWLAIAALILQTGPLTGQNWKVGASAGTGGLGIDLSYELRPGLAVRAGYSRLVIPYSSTQEIQRYQLQANVLFRMGGAILLADYNLRESGIRLTGGLLFNQAMVSLDIQSLSEYLYGDMLLPASDVGSVLADIKPALISPYAAMGYIMPLNTNKSISLVADLGVAYLGKPKITLSGTGLIGPLAGEMNQVVITNFLSRYRWYPIVSLGISFTFSNSKQS